jgi:hypothetical protein
MKNVKMKLALLSALSLASMQSMAALCTLSATPTGSAYIDAYNAGRTVPPLAGPAVSSLASRMNFGSDSPYAGSAGNCEVTGIANDNTSPETGYSLVASTNRILPSVTGGTTQIGTVIDRVWRKPAATAPTTPTAMCYFGTRVSNLINVAHGAPAGQSTVFEVNDIARGGFGSSGAVEVGYFVISGSNGTPTYRIGRTFTSVQHRGYKYGTGSTQAERQNNGIGYLDLPTIGGSATLDINGVNTPIAAGVVATTGGVATLQDAQVNSNWVDFTNDSVYADDDGGTNQSSSMTYIKAACDATSPSGWVKTGAISVRQTAQENATFKAIDISGYAPPGATVP